MKKMFNNTWRWLNGNKTILTGALWGFFQLTFASKHIPPDTLEVLRWGAGILTAASGVHHISKGYFTTKVGNQGQIMDDPLKEPKLKNTNVQK